MLAPLLLSSSVTTKLNLPVAKLEGNEAITVWQRRHTLQTRSLMFVSRLLPRGKKHTVTVDVEYTGVTSATSSILI